MDTASFIVERATIQQRMAARRQLAVSQGRSARSSLLPWALKAGVGLISGVRATRGSYGWMGSIAGALLLPVLMRFTGQKHPQPQPSIWHKLAQAAFPSLRL